jgi:hypothetical protein
MGGPLFLQATEPQKLPKKEIRVILHDCINQTKIRNVNLLRFEASAGDVFHAHCRSLGHLARHSALTKQNPFLFCDCQECQDATRTRVDPVIRFGGKCTKPERENIMMTSAGNPKRVALNRRASAPSTTTFSPRNRVFAIQNYGTACRLSCAPRNTEIGTKQRASGRGVAEEELQEEETRDYEGKRRPVMPRRRIWGSSSSSA